MTDGLGEPFTCTVCGRRKTKGWTDSEANAEHERNFPVETARGDETGLVCDDCYGWIYDQAAGRVRTENFGRMPPWTVPGRTGPVLE
jgi:hypothetical protein